MGENAYGGNKRRYNSHRDKTSAKENEYSENENVSENGFKSACDTAEC